MNKTFRDVLRKYSFLIFVCLRPLVYRISDRCTSPSSLIRSEKKKKYATWRSLTINCQFLTHVNAIHLIFPTYAYLYTLLPGRILMSSALPSGARRRAVIIMLLPRLAALSRIIEGQSLPL